MSNPKIVCYFLCSLLLSLRLIVSAGIAQDLKKPEAIGTTGIATNTQPMPITWATATWETKNGEEIIRLVLDERSNFRVLECSGDDGLQLGFCYLRDASEGDAERLMISSTFKTGAGGGTTLIFTKKFICIGGNFLNTPPEGAAGIICSFDELRPDALRESKSINLPFSTDTFDRAIKLEGKGRVAFVLQKGKGLGNAENISAFVEVPVDFNWGKTPDPPSKK